MTKTASNESGQALLLILLAMATVLTVALSVVSRSVTDVNVTTQGEESLRAFSAAEAGVEEALIRQIPLGQNLTGQPGEAGFTASIQGFPESARAYVYPLEIAAGESATIWLMSHDVDSNLVCQNPALPCYNSNTIDICWGKSGASGANPALEVSVLYEDAAGQLRIARTVYDRLGRVSGTVPGDVRNNCTIGTSNFLYQATVNFGSLGIPSTANSRLKLIKARMIYNTAPHTLGARGIGDDLPSQGRKIDSTGVSGEATRKVEVYALYPDVPSLFDSAIYSPNRIAKP